MCFKCLLCVYEEVRVKSRMRKVVLKNVNFSMLCWKNKKKFKKSKHQNRREKEEKERQTDDKRVKNSFVFINIIVVVFFP